MTRLSKMKTVREKLQDNLKTIQYSLDDDDISVRRRALDLLYGIANEKTAEEITDTLLTTLKKCDHAMKEEVVLKIAIVAEKHATDFQYVDTTLQLLEIAGDFVTEDVWHRIIQIVTNSEALQAYAAQKCFDMLQEDIIFEPLLKVSGYILGEFGYMIKVPSDKQFHAASLDTKSMLLTSFMKLANMFQDLVPKCREVFNAFVHSENNELQQRAVEYLTMATHKDQ